MKLPPSDNILTDPSKLASVTTTELSGQQPLLQGDIGTVLPGVPGCHDEPGGILHITLMTKLQ